MCGAVAGARRGEDTRAGEKKKQYKKTENKKANVKTRGADVQTDIYVYIREKKRNGGVNGAWNPVCPHVAFIAVGWVGCSG
jgi:hypothetical protein